MHYQQACRVLGLSIGARSGQVKQAYRQAVRDTHPDLHPGDPAARRRFEEIRQAYAVLLDAAGGVEAVLGAGLDRPPAGYSDHRLPLQVPRQGPDVRGELQLTLLEAFEGTVTDIDFEDREGCERCHGAGGEPEATLVRCPYCSGGPEGCRWCAGEGELLDLPCSSCHGAGVVEVQRSVRVAIPRSVRQGEELTLRERGRWGIQRRGDIYLIVSLNLPPGTRRSGDDIEMEVPVGVLQAVLGGAATVTGPDGIRYQIPVRAGSSSGVRCRLRGKGMYRSEHPEQTDRGDLYAVLSIQVPRELDQAERSLWERLLDLEVRRLQGQDSNDSAT